MMRPQIIAAAGILAASVTGVSQAAEVSEQGARELRSKLTHVLSHDLARSDFITVKPASNRYEITYDLSKFFDKISSSNFSVAGLKPLTMFAEPMAKGLWSIDGDNAIDISAHSKFGNGPATDVNYSLASLVYTGVFDPAISYVRSLDVMARDIRMSSQSGPQKIEARIGAMNYKLATVDGSEPGRVDVRTTGSMPGFYEKITAPSTPAVEVRADTLDYDVKADSVPVKEVRDLIRFIFEHVKAKKLSKNGSEKFKSLVRAAMPLFASVDETASVNNLSVATGNGNVGLKKLQYSFRMNGLTKSSSIGFGLRAEDLKLDAGAVPAGYEALVPEVAVLEVGVPDMDLADAVDVLLQADFSKPGPLSPEESERIEQLIFPNGAFTVDFPEISAKSGVYDIDISGSMTAYPEEKDRYSMQASILARDYDKTIAFIQNAAKTDPELNQLSFGMMMAKGFARTDPDGRQRWDVAIAEDGTVTVNGQVMKSDNGDDEQ